MKNKEKIDEILVTSKSQILSHVTTVPSDDVSTAETQPPISTKMPLVVVVPSAGVISALVAMGVLVLLLMLIIFLICFCIYRRKENDLGKFILQ